MKFKAFQGIQGAVGGTRFNGGPGWSQLTKTSSIPYNSMGENKLPSNQVASGL